MRADGQNQAPSMRLTTASRELSELTGAGNPYCVGRPRKPLHGRAVLVSRLSV